MDKGQRNNSQSGNAKIFRWIMGGVCLSVLLVGAINAQTLDTLRVSWNQVMTWADSSAMSNPLTDVHHYDIYVIPPIGSRYRLNTSPIVPTAIGTVNWNIKKRFDSGLYVLTVTAWGNKQDPAIPVESLHSAPVTFTIPMRQLAPTAPTGTAVRVKSARN